MPTALDSDMPSAELRAHVQALAQAAGQPITPAKAQRIAKRIKAGDFNPRLLTYADPTAEEAVWNVLHPKHAQKGEAPPHHKR